MTLVPETKNWHLGNALELVKLSEKAYKREGDPERAVSANHTYLSNNRALVYQDEHDVVLAFRGTQGVYDFAADLQTVQAYELGVEGVVHSGAQDLLMRYLGELESVVMDNLNGRRLWITGHSLGGQLGVIYAAIIRSFNNTAATVYTFGAPRPGDDEFRAWYSDQQLTVWNVVNDTDPIPRLPFPPRYRHVGKKVLLDEGTLKVDVPHIDPKNKIVTDDILKETLAEPARMLSTFARHSSIEYINQLSRASGQPEPIRTK